MIVIKTVKDISSLKHWDSWISQEYLDVVNKQWEVIDTEKIASVYKKWEDLVQKEMNRKTEAKKLSSMSEKELVDYAISLWIEASVKDKRADTENKILSII